MKERSLEGGKVKEEGRRKERESLREKEREKKYTDGERQQKDRPTTRNYRVKQKVIRKEGRWKNI